jgi:hypothetical protein
MMSTLDSLDPLGTALELMGRGLWPLAIKAGAKAPIGKDWGARKPTEAKLRATYSANPDAGVGLRLGAEGSVIDLEIDGPEGEGSLVRLLGGIIVPTMGWSSRRGPHHLFRFDQRLKRFNKSVLKLPSLPGLELRIGANCAQLQSVCPPTAAHRWNGHDEIVGLPQAAFDLLEKHACAGRIPPKPAQSAGFGSAGRRGGRSYGEKALHDECALVASAVEPHRHPTLEDAGLRIASLAKAGELDWADGRARLTDAARKSGLGTAEVRGLLDWAWLNANPRPRPSVNSRSESSLREDHDTHASAYRKKPVYQNSQPYVSNPENPDPQPCVSNLSGDVQEIVRKYGCWGGETAWWRVAFRLRRELEPIAIRQAWESGKWKQVVAFWLVVCVEKGLDLPGFDSLWADFKKKLGQTIKKPFGERVAYVQSRIPSVSVPWELEGFKYKPLVQVMIALSEEAAQRGDVQFIAEARLIARLAGRMNHMTAYRWLGVLRARGFVSLVEPGISMKGRPSGKANIWRWHYPPCPGETVWNSTTATTKKTSAGGSGTEARADGESPEPEGVHPDAGDDEFIDAEMFREVIRQFEEGGWHYEEPCW